MKKFFLCGIAVQIVILLISLILRDAEIIRNLDGLIIGGVLLVGSGMNQGSSGYEYVGLKEDGKKKMLSHQTSLLTRFTLFMLPAIIVLIAYCWFYGFDSIISITPTQ